MNELSIPKLNKAEMKGALMGMTLGDAYFYGNKNKCLSICHSPEQYDYLYWKSDILSQNTSIRKSGRTSIHSNKKTYPQEYILTKCHPIYTELYNLVWLDGKKTVTRKALNYLTPLGLAIWYMDDGSLTIHYAKKNDGTKRIKGIELNIHTEGFSFEENSLIVSYLKDTYDIEAKVLKTKGKYFKIYMNGTQGKKLIEIIKPYVIESMEYKISVEKKQLRQNK